MHTAFGLNWCSTGLELPELLMPGPTGAEVFPVPQGLGPRGGGASSQPIIDIVEEDPAQWPYLGEGAHDTPFLAMGPGDLRLLVAGIGQFRVSGGRTIAWSRSDPAVGDQDLRTFLLGSAVGALLIQRGLLVLHGNALVKEGRAIVCLGHSGAGKSTLAFALMRQGWQLLADDLVAISPDGQVLPGIPRIKLWEDAAAAFGLDPAVLPPVRQGLRKYLILGSAIDLARRPVPLQAIYFIHQQRHGSRESSGDGDALPISWLTSQQQAALRLRNHAFRPRYVRGLGQEGANFVALARLQRSAPLATLALPPGVPAMQQWLEGMDLLNAASSPSHGGPGPGQALAEVT